MDGSGVLTRQPGGRTGEAWFLGPWHVGRADDGEGGGPAFWGPPKCRACMWPGPVSDFPVFEKGPWDEQKPLSRGGRGPAPVISLARLRAGMSEMHWFGTSGPTPLGHMFVAGSLSDPSLLHNS